MALPKLYSQIEWQPILKSQSYGYRAGLGKEDITFCYGVAYKNNNGQKALFRMGADLVASLGWTKGDYIMVFQNPDDEYHLLLVKSDAKQGYVITKDQKGHAHSIQFRLPLTYLHPKTLSEKIEYQIHKGNQLIVQLPRHSQSKTTSTSEINSQIHGR